MNSIQEIFNQIVEGTVQPVNDLDFGDASYDPEASIDEIIAKNKVVVFGDVDHDSRALREEVGAYISTHKPENFITEINDETFQDRYDALYESGSLNLDEIDPAHVAAIQNGSDITFADPRTLEFKIDIVDRYEQGLESLNSTFNSFARLILPEYTRDAEISAEQEVIDTFAVVDLAFANKIMENAEEQGQSFVWVGSNHVNGIKGNLEGFGHSSVDQEQAAYIHMYPVNQDAYDQLQEYGIFEVNGIYIVPVLDTEETGNSLGSFIEHLDTVPGHTPNENFASWFAYKYGHLDLDQDAYTADDLDKIAKADFSP